MTTRWRDVTVWPYDPRAPQWALRDPRPGDHRYLAVVHLQLECLPEGERQIAATTVMLGPGWESRDLDPARFVEEVVGPRVNALTNDQTHLDEMSAWQVTSGGDWQLHLYDRSDVWEALEDDLES